MSSFATTWLARLSVLAVAVAALMLSYRETSDEGARPESIPISRPTKTDPSPVVAARPTATATGKPTRRELARLRLQLVKVADIPQATALAVAPGDDSIYVAQRTGFVHAIRKGRLQEEPILDISSEVDIETMGATGLLGLAFDPGGGYMYVTYADTKGDTRIVAYRFSRGRVDETSGRTLLSIRLTTVAHRGGNIAFGPDGYLWFGMGDGSLLYGGKKLGGDPKNYAQSLDNLNGKMLRFDPTPAGRRPYRIPVDNPFVAKRGAMPEIYLYGLRNPWRFSFDRATGDLWIGDVGQYILEEIDFLASARPAGANLGWNRLEGSRPFTGHRPSESLPPMHQYNHDDGRCAVVGGFVYRGRAIRGFQGTYVYGDFCDGKVRALVERRGRVAHERQDLGLQVDALSSFGEDASGELYVLSLEKGVFRIESGA